MPNIERLEQLKRVVRDAPDHLFGMAWVDDDTDCGTVRCAWGWASVDPWFRQNTDIDERGFAGADDLFGISWESAESLFCPDYLAQDREESTEEYARWANSIAKAEVIANIDRVIAGKRPVAYVGEPAHV